MSDGSASPRIERPGGAVAPEPRAQRWTDAATRERVLDHLVGVRSSKPSFYTAWRENSARLDRTIETLEHISAALCVTTEGPGALCEAVVEAAGHHFAARWAAMNFRDGVLTHGLSPVIVRSDDGRISRGWDEAPPGLRELAARALAAAVPVVSPAADVGGPEARSAPGGAVAVPMLRGEELAGALAVGLAPNVRVEESDLSILLTLANHAGVALHNACTLQESEELRNRAEAASREAERHATELERRSYELEHARRRLEDASRRQLLSQERNRIASELHDSVAQNILSIGMTLEWCRKQELLPSPVLVRLSMAKELARSTVAQIREVIFELSSTVRPADLGTVLADLVEELRHTTDLEIALRTRGRTRVIPASVERALSQIAREALFNVARHARGRHAWVSLRYDDHSVKLAVADDGRGDPKRLQRRLCSSAGGRSGYHRGLATIAERTRELDGSARFAPRSEGGVRLEVAMPLEPPGS